MNMKKILFPLLTLLSFASFAQVPSGSSTTTTVQIKGGQLVDSFHRPPLDTLASAPNGSYATKSGTPYYKTGGHWLPFGSGSGGPDTAINGLQNFSAHSFGLGGALTQTHTRISGSDIRDIFIDSAQLTLNSDGTIIPVQLRILDIGSSIHYDLGVTPAGVNHTSFGAQQSFDSHIVMQNIYGNGVLNILSSQNANGEAPFQMTLTSTGSKRPILVGCNCAGGSVISMENSGSTGNSVVEIIADNDEAHFSATTGASASSPYYNLTNSNTGKSAYFVLDPSGSSYFENYNNSSIDSNLFLKRGGFVGIGNISSPTAYLHTKPSTTAAASFRTPAGVAPTSPNDGDHYNSSADHHYRVYLNGAWEQLDQQTGGSSGAYVPTTTPGVNLTGATADSTFWTREGNIVTVYGSMTVTITAASNTSSFATIQLPVASNLGAHSLWGGGSTTANSSGTEPICTANTSTNTASFQFYSNTTGAMTVYFNFRYIVQ